MTRQMNALQLKAPWWEDLLRFACQHAFFVLGVLGLMIIALLYRLMFTAPLESPLPPASTAVPGVSPTGEISAPLALSPTSPAALETPAFPTPLLPASTQFTLVFIPVNWQADHSAFEAAAQRQADAFIRETHIELYYRVNLIFLETGLEDASLSNSALVYDVQEFAILNNVKGDRYVGLTDGDLRPGGESSVVGWTSGGKVMVAESDDEYVVTHELGHTFGLCDEYSYADWKRQNERYAGGCPNSFPKNCPQDENTSALCEGTSASVGSNSIMGPAGLFGEYSFNEESLTHLEDIFQESLQEGKKP